MSNYVLWFDKISKEDIAKVGGKGANLGEMVKIGIPVPNGFVVTSEAYYEFINQPGLKEKIAEILKITNVQNSEELQQGSEKIKSLIKSSPIPDEIANEVIKSYLSLSSFWGLKQTLVAVRSSATAEDLPDASFAGQQETFLNVRGEANVVNRVRDCWASLFTPRAIFYREVKKYDHFKVGVAVPVQKMIQSEVSGVMFTINPVSNDKKQIVIEAVWGLGEMIVQGQVTPDHYCLDRKTLRITNIEVNKQTVKLERKGSGNSEESVPRNMQETQKLNSLQITQIAKIGLKIHDHYYYPQDVEWAIEKGVIYIVQTRPVTTVKEESHPGAKDNSLKLILEGEPASPGVASGKVKIIKSLKEINKVKKGEILVTGMTTPDFVPAMRIVSGIITDKGGQTSHAAIVSRELGIPCVVGTKTSTQALKNGQLVTIDGEKGEVYESSLVKKIKKNHSVSNSPDKKARPIKTATKIYVNLGEPELAAEIAKRDVDGVGLLRAEFMIAQIGTHPQKLIAEGKGQLFTEKLAKGIATFCKAFQPRPVVYRATDFKTNEYANLEGGKIYEPKEENPMLGFRGASRYIATPQVFQLELEAIKIVRNKLKLKNLWLMIPFVRTPKELLDVKKIIASVGLTRTPSFKLWMMVEIPSNVILLKDFVETGIDGISIGSNDLTMLTLGLDRDNSEVAYQFDERNKAVLWMLRRTVTTAAKLGITTSICGQAPSNYPDLVEKLVRWGTTSVSVSPDAITRTKEIIHWAEKKIMSEGDA